MERMHKALEGLKVLELAEFGSGPYCAKLMADLGADVIKIEPPQGDEARKRGPFPEDIPHPEKSGLFLYLNTNKSGITLNLETEAGQNIFRRLIRETDILIEGTSPGYMEGLGLGYSHLEGINPKLIVTSITRFGLSGPYTNYKAYYLNTFHAGGEGYCLPGGLGWLLYSEREPIKAGGYLGEYDIGMCACIATLASIYGLQVNQKGQQIDISAQEALLGVMRHELSKYNNDWIESRATRAFPLGGLMQCKDGFVQIMPLEKHMWTGLMELMGNPEWSKEEKYDWDKLIEPFAKALPQRLEDQGKANDYLEQWALKHTTEEIYQQGQAKGCAVGKVNTIEDLFRCRQLKSRNFFVEFEHPVVGKLPYPSTAIKYSKTPWRMERPAPLLGQHNEEVYCGILNFTREELVQLRQMGVI